MRLHVGKHLLQGTIDIFSCGFCGQLGEHKISLKKTTHQILIPQSNCPYFMKFSLASAAKQTTRKSFTNRPLACEVCGEVYWSYSLQKHYSLSHEGFTCPLEVTETEKNGFYPKSDFI